MRSRNLQMMVDDAKSRGMHAFAATIPPMVPPGDPGRTKGYALVPAYNDMIRATAASEAVPLVDVYGAFGSDASSLIGNDGLHPNAAGYQRIADTFFASIKTVLESQSLTSVGGHRVAQTGRRAMATGGECSGLP
ncbi:MAG TPA: SGNH/GDSL hydrolase family protein [Vicinamibacterales bacterium]